MLCWYVYQPRRCAVLTWGMLLPGCGYGDVYVPIQRQIRLSVTPPQKKIALGLTSVYSGTDGAYETISVQRY